MKRVSITSWLLIAFIVLTAVATPDSAIAKPRIQSATVKITERGYEPYVLKFRRGMRARITFIRTTDATCATEVVISEFSIRRALPLNQPVAITFVPRKRGEFSFTCSMNMMRGRLIVQ